MTQPRGSLPARTLELIERRSTLTPAGVSVVGSAALVWLVGLWLGSRVLFLMAYAIVALLGALAIIGRRRLRLNARRSKLPSRIREEQLVTIEVTMSSERRLSGLALEEEQHPLVSPPVRLVADLHPGEEVAHRYAIAPEVRGIYEVGPLVAIWSDPFGLTRRRTNVLEPARIIVHPSTEGVRDRVLSREWEDPPIRPPISKPWPHGFEFYGMREYVPGDDPRRIVWRAVARTGRYLVREAEQGITDRVTMLLDTDADRHAEGEPSPTFETAVRAVASLAMHHLNEGFVVAIDTPEARLVPPTRGRRGQIPILDALASVARGSRALPDAVTRLLRDPRRDTHHVLVATHLDHASARMLRVVLQRGSSMTFVHVGTELPDTLSMQRAAALGCELVEARVGQPLDAVFRRAVGAGLRR